MEIDFFVYFKMLYLIKDDLHFLKMWTDRIRTFFRSVQQSPVYTENL